jgi:competence protein ComEC
VTFFSNNPFTKILSFWLIGIVAGNFLPWAGLTFIILFLISGALVTIKLKTKSYPFDRYFSIFLSLGFVLTAFYTVPQSKFAGEDQQQRFVATILEYPTEKPNSYQSLIQINWADSAFFNNQKILAYFEKSDSAFTVQPGDRFVGTSRLQRIRNQGDPFAFNYQKFMANRDVYYSTYLADRNYMPVANSHDRSVRFRAERFRASLISTLRKYIRNDESLQVISALTLGYRKELSPETRSYFASTGAMHVLAVSGLHVGMIYLFLTTLFGFLKRSPIGRICFVLLIGSLLWFYALLTGFSPSVQRATVMFSFILVGNSLQRPAAIYNSIAASAFLLLLVNPKLLFEVGFQLSYSAVISIVFFYPRLEKWVQPKNRILQKMWQLFCVSLAAQLGTFALSIYYFHQFPVYFWLSNFIVLPAAYIILGSTFLVLIFSPVSWLAGGASIALSAITYLITFLLRQIDQLPFSLVENISFSNLQLSLLAAMGCGIIFFIKLKQKDFLFAATILLVAFLASGLTEKLHSLNQKKYIIYASEQNVHLINGRKNYLISTAEEPKFTASAQHVVRELQLEPPTMIHLDSCEQLIREDLIIDKQVILFLDQPFRYRKRTENQQNHGGKVKRSSSHRTSDFDPSSVTKTDSVMKKEMFFNLSDLQVQQTIVTDL